ncbi:MAG: hypothetical protein QE283_03775 [Rhodoferax sp.]|nr:hypothetical protein [Rhodoferax sp.]
MISKTPRFSDNLAPRRCLVALCVVATTLVVSCGGQSSGTSNSNSNGNGQQQGQDGGGTASFTMSGAYSGTAAGNASEFVSFITPDQRLYALFALQIGDKEKLDVYPIIYTGSVNTTGNTSATVASLNSFQNQDNLRQGTAAISGTSATAHTLSLSNLYIPTLNANPQFNVLAAGATANAQGTWTGTWADGLNGAIARSVNLTLAGTFPGPYTAQTGFGSCTDMALTITRATDATTALYFSAQVDIHPAINCRWSLTTTKTLTGIGFIHDSPVTPKKRLELILTDTSGSGISFRGDQ